MNRRSKACERGFTLLEMMIVVAIVGITATLVIPNLIQSAHAAKQRATVSDIRTLGEALIAWRLDHLDVDGEPRELSPEELKTMLEPRYLKKVRFKDKWNHKLRLEISGEESWITITSPGRDGVFEAAPEEGAFSVEDLNGDIVWSDGAFMRWPEGSGSGSEEEGEDA